MLVANLEQVGGQVLKCDWLPWLVWSRPIRFERETAPPTTREDSVTCARMVMKRMVMTTAKEIRMKKLTIVSERLGMPFRLMTISTSFGFLNIPRPGNILVTHYHQSIQVHLQQRKVKCLLNIHSSSHILASFPATPAGYKATDSARKIRQSTAVLHLHQMSLILKSHWRYQSHLFLNLYLSRYPLQTASPYSQGCCRWPQTARRGRRVDTTWHPSPWPYRPCRGPSPDTPSRVWTHPAAEVLVRWNIKRCHSEYNNFHKPWQTSRGTLCRHNIWYLRA